MLAVESRTVARWTACLAAASLVAAAIDCGGGGYNSTPTTTPPSTTGGGGTADVVIAIVGIAGGMSYSPNPANVKAGQKVAWRNDDNIPHTATQTGNGFDTGTIAGGATSTPLTIGTAGSLSYFCRIHPAMVGTLNVTP
jgi:plastocyanin